MADGLPVSRVRRPELHPLTYFQHTRVRTPRMLRTYATIQTQTPSRFSPVSDVAILADPSRRYSEIYGDATVGTLDCDREVAGGDEEDEKVEGQKTESVFRV